MRPCDTGRNPTGSGKSTPTARPERIRARREHEQQDHQNDRRRRGQHTPRTRAQGSVVRTTLTGGFVPNSYKYRADCDHVTIEGRKVASLTVLPQRAWAQKRSHGDGDTQITRYIADGQSVGTIAHKE